MAQAFYRDSSAQNWQINAQHRGIWASGHGLLASARPSTISRPMWTNPKILGVDADGIQTTLRSLKRSPVITSYKMTNPQLKILQSAKSNPSLWAYLRSDLGGDWRGGIILAINYKRSRPPVDLLQNVQNNFEHACCSHQ